MKHIELILADEQNKTEEISKFIEDILLPARSVNTPTTVTRNLGFFSSTETHVVEITSSLDENKINEFFRVRGYAKQSNTPRNAILLTNEFRDNLRRNFSDIVRELETEIRDFANLSERRTEISTSPEKLESSGDSEDSEDIDVLIDQLRKNHERLVLDQHEFLQTLQKITNKLVRIVKLRCLMAMKLILVMVKAELNMFLHFEALKQN